MRTKSFDANTEKPTKLVLTLDESCEVLNCSRSKLYDLAKRGEIKILKMGRASRTTLKNLQEYVDRLAAE